MSRMIVYDKAAYHLAGEFPDDIEPDQAFVPTGLFFAWLVIKGMVTADSLQPFASEVEALSQRRAPPSSFYKACDGVFESRFLTEEGQRFTEAYFDFDSGAYLDDLEEVLSNDLPTHFHIADTWENFDKLSSRIAQRLEELQR